MFERQSRPEPTAVARGEGKRDELDQQDTAVTEKKKAGEALSTALKEHSLFAFLPFWGIFEPFILFPFQHKSDLETSEERQNETIARKHAKKKV